MRDVDVFLFDEPLSNLDAKLRSELRVEIKRLHQQLGNTMIYVTHDQIEAMTLADRIAVMQGGADPAARCAAGDLQQPVNRFVAGFIGSPAMNFIDGERRDGGGPVFRAERAHGPARTLCVRNGRHRGAAPRPSASGPSTSPSATAATSLPFSREVEVDIVEPMGSDTLVWTRLGRHELLASRRVRKRASASGERVTIGFDPARASLFDAASGDRI